MGKSMWKLLPVWIGLLIVALFVEMARGQQGPPPCDPDIELTDPETEMLDPPPPEDPPVEEPPGDTSGDPNDPPPAEPEDRLSSGLGVYVRSFRVEGSTVFTADSLVG